MIDSMRSNKIHYAGLKDPKRYLRKNKVPYPLYSFKDRTIDMSSPVQVYRNIRGKNGYRYSIRQNGLVVAHGDCLMLKDASFVVNASGRQKVLLTGYKNVHAWIKGRLIPSGCGTSHDGDPLPVNISYNPRRHKTFVDDSGHGVCGAMTVLIKYNGVSAAYVDWI